MNHVINMTENVFRPYTLRPTPVCLQEAIVCAIKLEKTWLTPAQLAKLIDLFEREPHAVVAYQSMKDEEDLRKSWVCMKIHISVPEDGFA